MPRRNLKETVDYIIKTFGKDEVKEISISSNGKSMRLIKDDQ